MSTTLHPDWTMFDGDNKPSQPGWYPVLICWEPHEGTFPDSSQWNGEKWHNGFIIGMKPVTHFGPVHPDEQAAVDWAYQHDPEW